MGLQMSKVPNHGKLPEWITEHVPVDLIESSLFRFDVQLQAIEGYICRDCGAIYSQPVKKCVADAGGNHLCNSSSFRAAHKKVTVDLLPDIDLDYDILLDQMQSLPAQYAFWSAVYSEARLKVAVEERRMKAARGRATEEVQRRAAQEKIRFTADQVKAVIEADKTTEEAEMRYQLAQMQCGKLFHMLKALEMKADQARSLAGFKKQEYDGSQ